jgi:tetratricopeptide (TPR) repeat protein
VSIGLIAESCEESMSENRDVSIADSALEPLEQARAHLAAERPAEAVALLEKLVQQEPGNALAYQELAKGYVGLVRLGEAVAAARRALELDPSLARPHGILAWVAMNRGRYGEARAELHAQLEALPADDAGYRAAVHNQLGFMDFQHERYPEAEAALREALRLAPAEAIPRFNLAMVYLRTRRREEAQAELERLLGQAGVPKDVAHSAHFNLGHLYARRGRYDAAREQFAGAMALNPTWLARLYRAAPFLARFPLGVVFVVLIVLALIVWNLLRFLG